MLVRREARRSAATRSVAGTKWLYTFKVVDARAWPRRPATVEIGTPPVKLAGGHVVADVVQADLREPDLLAQPAEAVGDRVGPPRAGSVRVEGEHEAPVGEADPAQGSPLLRRVPVPTQDLDGVGIERHDVGPVGLAVLHHQAVEVVHHSAGERGHADVEIKVAPAQPADLAPTGPRRRRQAQVGPELDVVLGRGVEQPAELGGRGRPDLALPAPGRRRPRGRVVAEETPADRLLEAGPQDRVDPRHRGPRQRLAPLSPTAAELGVEPVDVDRGHPAQLNLAPPGP